MLEHYLFLALVLSLTAAGQVFYKLYFVKKQLYWLILTILCFVFTPYVTYLALKGLALDTVYMCTALTIIAVMACSVIFLGETLSYYQKVGTAFILLGIVIYNV